MIRFEIPNVAALLAAQGYAGTDLDALLEAVREKYGDYAWLPPGAYHVTATLPARPERSLAAFTNHQVLMAFWEIGGGATALLERAGLKLGDLLADQDGLFAGPTVDDMTGLSETERTAVYDRLSSQPVA